jgi:diguanylate cyclase (GGDEF)-like protein
MLSLFGEPSRRRFLVSTATPILAAGFLLNVLGAVLLYWSTARADDMSLSRQRDLVELVLSKLVARVAHEQESVTVWDDALEAVQGSGDRAWIDTNLGSWMHTYFGHDGAFIVDPDDDLAFASVAGTVADDAAFEEVSHAALPLVARLRSRLAAGDDTGVSDRVLTVGEAGLARIGQRPAVISVKPIVSDSGDIETTPGREYLHVALRYLDQELVQELRNDYLLSGLRFSWTNDAADQEIASPLATNRGENIGYFIWTPYRPGTAVRAHMLPMLGTLSVIGLTALALLLAGLRKRSLTLLQSQETIRHLAAHDVLTDLPNRAQFETQLGEALRSARATGDGIALLYLDLDRFKQVNDTLGHPAGDELLRIFAARLARLTPGPNTVARLSGDEFTVILRDPAVAAEAEELCHGIIDGARHPFEIKGNQVFVGVSIGVAIAPPEGVDGPELTRRADVALYRAKAAGRSGYAVFSPEMDVLINERRNLEVELRAALSEGSQLEVEYQPLVTAGSRKLSGIEALVRWRHPQRGLMAPDVFIPLAEEAGLIGQIGELVLRRAVAVATRLPVDVVAVNVSAIELRDAGYAGRVAGILAESGIDPRRLELELTESALADSGGACARNIAALRRVGVRFALDDFGTGFSSLGRLQELDVDRIKIDRSFVQGFGTDNGDEAIIRAIVDLARATGLRTTAEGVETPEQGAFLKSIGCDELQGFLFAKPMSEEQVAALVSSGTAFPEYAPRMDLK